MSFMKHSLLFVILLFPLSATCQNIIFTSDDTIFVTIKEPSSENSKLIHNDTTSIPAHSMIIIDHGYFVNGQEFSKKELRELLKKNDDEAFKKWESAYNLEILSYSCLSSSLGTFLGCLISRYSKSQEGLYILGGVMGGFGIIFGICCGLSYSKAIKIYNSHIPSSSAQLDFQISSRGIGFAYKF